MIIVFALSLIFSVFTSTAFAAGESQCFAIVGTNDVHGVLEPHHVEQASSDASARYGGVLTFSGYVSILRQQYQDRMLLLDGGDIFQGTLASNLSQGEAMIAAYNALGYNASAVGNHEFDYGPLVPGHRDRLAVLKTRIAEAQFPFLAVNIFENTTHRRVRWPNLRASQLVDVGGKLIGLIGAASTDTPQTTRPINVTTLEFPDPAPFIVAEARNLRAHGAQMVILMAHIGGKCPDTHDPNNLSSCSRNDTNEMLTLLESMPFGTVDIAIAGHTHQYMAHWINGTATLESGARSQAFGYVEACLNDAGHFDREHTQIHGVIPLCRDVFDDTHNCQPRTSAAVAQLHDATFLNQTVAPAEEVVEVVQPYLDKAQGTAQEMIGVMLPTPLGETAQAAGQPMLGDLVAEGMRRAVDADIAIQNRGGVRTDLPAGSLSYGQVYQVLPFDNEIVRVELTGAQIQHFVETLSHRGVRLPPYVAGLSVQVGKSGELTVLHRGKPLRLTKKYRVATNDFLLQGGDGLEPMIVSAEKTPYYVSPLSMRQALIDLLKEKYPQK